MDSPALRAAAAAAAAPYASFADATRAVLDVLERHLPGAAVFLAHLDRTNGVHRMVETRGGRAPGLDRDAVMPLAASFCLHMAEGTGPRCCSDVERDPVYGELEAGRRLGARSYVGAPVELSDGTRVAALAAVAAECGRFDEGDLLLVATLARILAYELERETTERDLRRLTAEAGGRARAVGALTRVARALVCDDDPRPAVCEAAREITRAPIAFLLEPAGRELVSTAMAGIEMAPVALHARDGADGTAAAALADLDDYFVPDATAHPALAPTLLAATGARSALFQPVLRNGAVGGVLVVMWNRRLDRLPEETAELARLVAAQAAVAIEQVALRRRIGTLAGSDALTGLVTRRAWDAELPRALARARRAGADVAIALLDLDGMAAFNAERGEREGDRLIKETAAAWAAALREVDVLARIDGQCFGLVLPGCDADRACEVLARVRAATPRGRTASAGVARWDGFEPPEGVLGRCERALATAKAAGRDLTVVAD